jgi:HK97 family phage major capsid protein
VAAQQTQNTAVTSQQFTESDLVVSIRTFAGQQIVSRQAFERGAGIGQILMADLMAEYATQTNISALNGAAASVGGYVGILNETSVQTASWTGTTGASLVSSLHNAIGKINAARYLPADLIVMHPRRWAWLAAQSDSSNRPLIQIDGPGFNAQGNGVAGGYGAVGSVAGIPVITDAGVPTTLGAATNEDRIIVTRRSDILFWEDAGAPVGLTFEEVLGDQLTVKLVAYGMSAFTAGRYPVATAVLSGTGFTQVLT